MCIYRTWIKKYFNEIKSINLFDRAPVYQQYILLWKLAKSLEISNKSMLFFKMHMYANHFKTTEDKLSSVWQQEPEKVKNAYEFIANHQIDMWH